jgi:hypothetical protein
MGTSLSVKDSGSWRTIVEPYVNVDGTWKTVHKVWIKSGGSWRLAHKTALSRYTVATSGINESASGSTTIAEGVRYLKVTINGSGGGGGGGMSTSGSYSGGQHLSCPLPTPVDNPTYPLAGYDYTAGGAGGAGGFVQAIMNVSEGETYSWTFNSIATTGGSGGAASSLYLAGSASTGVGTTGSATSGGGLSGSISFTGPDSTSLIAYSGNGGVASILTVSAICAGYIGFYTTQGGGNFPDTYVFGQTVSASGASAGGNGTASASGSRLESGSTTTTGGGSAGGAGRAALSGTDGTGGNLSWYQYKASRV